MSKPVTTADAVALGAIIDAAQRGAPVVRLQDGGRLVFGTARRISGDHSDVWLCGLDVTTRQGMEVRWSLAALIREWESGEVVFDYDPAGLE